MNFFYEDDTPEPGVPNGLYRVLEFVDVPSAFAGTRQWLNPQQFGSGVTPVGSSLDARTDVYSLGVMLFQLAVGELPFRGSFEVQLASKLTDDAPDPRDAHRRCGGRAPDRRGGGERGAVLPTPVRSR